MDSGTITLLVLVAISFIVAALAALLVTGLFRQRQRRLIGLQTATQLRRSAEHIHLVAQACHLHTGNADIGRALHQLAVRILEDARVQAPRDPVIEHTLQEYQQGELSGSSAPAAAPASDLSEDEAGLSRARLLLTEAVRLMTQIERDGWIEPTELQQMRDNIQQARRAVDLRLRLRHAAQTEYDRFDPPDLCGGDAQRDASPLRH